jgi:hypothetical protein
MTASPIEFRVTSARSFSSKRALLMVGSFHHVPQGLRQPVIVEPFFEQEILRTPLDGQLGDFRGCARR